MPPLPEELCLDVGLSLDRRGAVSATYPMCIDRILMTLLSVVHLGMVTNRL